MVVHVEESGNGWMGARQREKEKGAEGEGKEVTGRDREGVGKAGTGKWDEE